MIVHELKIFLIVGILAVLIDFLMYRAVISAHIMETALAKGFGFCSGALFAYFANRYWTFNRNNPVNGGVIRFIILYSITLAANVIINSITLNLFIDQFNYIRKEDTIRIAFIIATAASATLNFVGLKYFVFKSQSHEVIE